MGDYDHSQALLVFMRRVLKLHRQNVDLLISKYEVLPGQPPILLRLLKEDGMVQKELAEEIYIKPATLTVTIDRMEKVGFVIRQPDPQDQRISRVFLTEKGRTAALAVREVMRELELKCFEHFSEEEKELFRSMLTKVNTAMLTYQQSIQSSTTP
ncbi:MarR family winged helix-turn-helix transcriptional regulator [Brevibacillus sp. TJ4]|uniref:MarR family winged helix-turn-helix transcriptional regulator n=1 Tax=Brevibacillus sp. TJ4 TaxID=3234853 RepID=UPI0037D69A0D